MKCKKHLTDLSSCVGVCASCLRERLVEVIAAQVRAQREAQLRLVQAQQDCRKSDAQQESLMLHPPLDYRGSVSPRRSHRKSDYAASGDGKLPGNRLRFHSTPLVGPTGLMSVGTEKDKRNGAGKITSVFMGYFRSKSERTGLDQGPVWDRGVSAESNYVASRSWFSGIIPGLRKKQIRSFCVEEDGAEPQRKGVPSRGRGMSPSNLSDGEDDEQCRIGSSGYSSEPSPNWKMTPRSTPSVHRSRGRKTAAAAAHSRNVSGLAFCLSPLVHPGPTRNWSQKVTPPDATVAAGDGRVPPKPHLSTAASFGKNRSRKLADFGKQSCNLHLNY